MMGGRIARRVPPPEAPRPFSSEWLATDPQPEPVHTRFRLPNWIPDGRSLSAGLVVLIALTTALVTILGSRGVAVDPIDPPPTAVIAAPTQPPPTTAPQPTVVVAEAPVAPEAAPAFDDAQETTLEGADPALAQAPSLEAGPPAPLATAPPGALLLPEYRIVTFYGHPHDANMGIAGELSMEDLATAVRNEAANYAAADPSRPVIPAFELIATVAQRVPGADGTYILDTDHETLTSYIDYAEQEGLLVILDLQIGRGTVANEIEKVRDLLARPNVHLAIDPEFAVAEGEIPGEYIGSVPAESILYAQKTLAEISAENGLGPKILIVHQFREDMIQGKERLEPYPGVQLVIDADGYGAPELKTAVYNFLVRDEPVEFAGVKLFYRQDVPLMTPREILALVPPPDVIIYQ